MPEMDWSWADGMIDIFASQHRRVPGCEPIFEEQGLSAEPTPVSKIRVQMWSIRKCFRAFSSYSPVKRMKPLFSAVRHPPGFTSFAGIPRPISFIPAPGSEGASIRRSAICRRTVNCFYLSSIKDVTSSQITKIRGMRSAAALGFTPSGYGLKGQRTAVGDDLRIAEVLPSDSIR